jgi:hypothetical protein
MEQASQELHLLLSAVPRQVPELHESFIVHKIPSSQLPLTGCFLQFPVKVSQTPTVHCVFKEEQSLFTQSFDSLVSSLFTQPTSPSLEPSEQ